MSTLFMHMIHTNRRGFRFLYEFVPLVTLHIQYLPGSEFIQRQAARLHFVEKKRIKGAEK